MAFTNLIIICIYLRINIIISSLFPHRYGPQIIGLLRLKVKQASRAPIPEAQDKAVAREKDEAR